MAIDRYDSDRSPDPGCLERRELPAAFLRLYSPREQMALPYASLLNLVLKLDQTALELHFITHKVTVTGKTLAEIYIAIAEQEARVVRVVSPQFDELARVRPSKSIVTGIRIEPPDESERLGR